MIPFIRKAAKQVPSGKHFGLDDRSKSIPLLFPPEKHAKRMKDVPSEIVDEVARLCACAISGFRTSRLKRETQGDREREKERGNGSIRSLEGVVVSRYLREVSLMSMFATLGGGFLGRPDGMLAGELVARHTGSRTVTALRLVSRHSRTPHHKLKALHLVARVNHGLSLFSSSPSFSLPIPLVSIVSGYV